MDKDVDYTIVMSLREVKVDGVSGHLCASINAANIDFVVNSGRKCYIANYIYTYCKETQFLCRSRRDMNHLISKFGRNLK